MARSSHLLFYQRVVEAWKSRERVVFDAEALAMERGGGVAVEWDAAFGSMRRSRRKGRRKRCAGVRIRAWSTGGVSRAVLAAPG